MRTTSFGATAAAISGSPTENWQIASARPLASSDGRAEPSATTHFTLLASMPAALAKAGNSKRTELDAVSATVLPSRSFGELIPLPFTAKIAWPAVTLRYSADSLLRYATWQLVERDASVKLAHQPTWSTPDRQQSVAMFWIVSETPRGRRLHYSSGTYGFSSLVELYPESKLALVVLSNKAAAGAQDGLRALTAKIVEELRPEPVTSPTPADVPPAAR